ncbi:MAG: hypothetical protein ABIS28_16125 [Caldimonas sp.]
MKFLDLFKPRTPIRAAPATTHGPAARALRNAQDDTLSPAAHAWVRSLPAAMRPLELCNVYPRIANRLARCWDDIGQTHDVFNDLLVDRRGGRKGFPSPIASELLRLQAFHERRLTATVPKTGAPR